MLKKLASIISVTGFLGVFACGGIEPGAAFSTDPVDAMDPTGTSTPLKGLTSDKEVQDAVHGAWEMVADGRPLGMELFIAALKAELKAHKIDSSVIDKIDESHIGEALPLPKGSGTSTPSSDGYGEQTFALDKQGYEKYFKCPIMSPEKNNGTECDKLVQGVVQKVKNQIDKNKAMVESKVKSTYKDLSDTAQNFITAWAMAAQQHGSSVAAVYATHELRSAAKCDVKNNGMKISYILGVKQGSEIVLSMKAWAMQQVSACVVNINSIAKQVKVKSVAKIDAYMSAHKVCEDADISQLNDVLKKSEVKRKEGMKIGIDQTVEVLKSEMHSYRADHPCTNIGQCISQNTTQPRNNPCFMSLRESGDTKRSGYHYKGWWQTVNGNKVCCRVQRQSKRLRCVGKSPEGATVWCKEDKSQTCMACYDKYLYIGSPIVIDLDNDGVTMAERPVKFDLLADGVTQTTAWVSPREAILALDLDGDGRINSGAELFGNRSDCGEGKCYDGVAALAARDSNSDGMIDSRDAVYSSLKLWLDRNSDGVSQAGELVSLASRGVRAISLQADYLNDRRTTSTITAKLKVLTDSGVRDAYDVWFNMKLRQANLASLMP